MMDIETLSKKLPKPYETKRAKDPISCIVIYDNLEDQVNKKYIDLFVQRLNKKIDNNNLKNKIP